VNGYTINYTATVRDCTEQRVTCTISLDGSAKIANITGLEENSEVVIVVTAYNAAGGGPRFGINPVCK